MNKQVRKFNEQLPETSQVQLRQSESGLKYMFVRGDGVKSKVYPTIREANQAFVNRNIAWRGEK